jgi:hypothetical protein
MSWMQSIANQLWLKSEEFFKGLFLVLRWFFQPSLAQPSRVFEQSYGLWATSFN